MDNGQTLLLNHHLKSLRLPVFSREYPKLSQECAQKKADYPTFLFHLSERELVEREQKGIERRIKQARFPARKSLDTYDFKAMPSLNKAMVLQLSRCEYIDKRENIIACGNNGTGKTHIALALGLAACQKRYSVRFFTAAELVTVLSEARDDKALGRIHKTLDRSDLVIVDELGYVPFSKTGAELLFEFFSRRYERGSCFVTTNLPFEEWTQVLGNERMTAALLDRLTHRVHILEMNGESYRFKESMKRKAGSTGKSGKKG